MSQNSFDFENAIAGLKANTPGRLPNPATLARMTARPIRSWLNRSIAVGVIALAGAGVFWRQSSSTVAWAQVVDQIRQSPRLHIRLTLAHNSQLISEQWIDGARYAFKMWGPNSKRVVSYSVCDGRYVTSLQCFGNPRNGRANTAVRYKADSAQDFQSVGYLGAESNLIDDVIKSRDYRVLEQAEIDTPAGKRIKYRVARTFTYHVHDRRVEGNETTNFYVDPKSKRVVKAEALSAPNKVVSTLDIEYPDRISDEKFNFPQGEIPVVDLDSDRRKVAETIQRGFGTRRARGSAITLRAVLYDDLGGLWVLWSGALPRGELAYPVRVLGLPTPRVTKFSYPTPYYKQMINVFGLKAFTLNATESDRPSKVLPSIDSRIGGMALGIHNGKFQTVDLVIPILDSTGSKKLGEGTFRKVPVHRIGSIYSYGKELGLR